jgi:hypothetical protein
MVTDPALPRQRGWLVPGRSGAEEILHYILRLAEAGCRGKPLKSQHRPDALLDCAVRRL